MASNSSKIKNSLNIEPKASPTLNEQGDVGFDSSTDKLKVRHSATTRSVVTEDATQTLTNKTIDASTNTLTGVTTNSGTQTLTNKTLVVASNTVTTASSGNLTATELNAALAELQADVDTRALATSGTLTTPSTDIVTFDGQASTPASPSAGNYKVYVSDTTNKLTVLDSNGTATTVGSGAGGINYISNGDAEAGTTGWATYADAAATSPVDGTGGSANITITASSSSPLRGTKSFLISKDAANRQGEGVSYAFTIDAADKGRVLKIQFDYNVTTNYVDDDVRLYIYDVTNSRLIEPAPNKIKKADSSINTQIQPFEFQTSIDSTSYRLILHVAGTTATAWDMKVDNIVVGPSAVSSGPFISDWQSFTSTLTGSTTNPTNVTTTAYYRRVGDSADVFIKSHWGVSSTLGSGDYIWSLPFSIDSNKVPSSNGFFGDGNFYDNGSSANARNGSAYYHSATQVKLYLHGAGIMGSGITGITAAGDDVVTLRFRVPVQGWSSNQKLSSDSGASVTGIELYKSSNQASTAATLEKISFDTARVSKNVTFDDSNDRASILVSGSYLIIGQIGFSNTTAEQEEWAQIRINGATGFAETINTKSSVATNGYSTREVMTLQNLNAGDYVELWGRTTSASRNYVGTSNFCATKLILHRLGGPEQIAASDTIAVGAVRSVNQTGINPNNSYVQLQPNSTVFDTHATWNTSTYRFTAQISGKYRLSASAAFSSTNVVANQYMLYLYKNGASFAYIDQRVPTAANPFGLSGSLVVNLVTGDYLELYLYGAGNNSVSTLTASVVNVYIERTGN